MAPQGHARQLVYRRAHHVAVALVSADSGRPGPTAGQPELCAQPSRTVAVEPDLGHPRFVLAMLAAGDRGRLAVAPSASRRRGPDRRADRLGIVWLAAGLRTALVRPAGARRAYPPAVGPTPGISGHRK